MQEIRDNIDADEATTPVYRRLNPDDLAELQNYFHEQIANIQGIIEDIRKPLVEREKEKTEIDAISNPVIRFVKQWSISDDLTDRLGKDIEEEQQKITHINGLLLNLTPGSDKRSRIDQVKAALIKDIRVNLKGETLPGVDTISRQTHREAIEGAEKAAHMLGLLDPAAEKKQRKFIESKARLLLLDGPEIVE